MKVLSFDPSGNYNEGKGTSGYAISVDNSLPFMLGDIKSEGFSSRQAYWYDHSNLIKVTNPDVVVIESYKLFGHKSKQQIGSILETPQMIGYLEMVCWELNIPVIYQDPSTKLRHTDEILTKLEILTKHGNKHYYKGESTNLHMRDALRHNIYFVKYGKGKKK